MRFCDDSSGQNDLGALIGDEDKENEAHSSDVMELEHQGHTQSKAHASNVRKLRPRANRQRAITGGKVTPLRIRAIKFPARSLKVHRPIEAPNLNRPLKRR